jgi:hypothetical protein
MAQTVQFVKFVAQLTGGLTGDRTIEVEWDVDGSTTEATTEQSLTQNTNNQITGPAGDYKLVLVIPPADNAQAYTLKGANGDSGVECFAAQPTLVPLNGNLIIHLAAGSDQTFTFVWL